MSIKKSLFITIPFILGMGFASCTKCKVCTKESQPEVRLCEDDYNSTTAYGIAVDTYKSQGYECKESL